MPHKGFKHTEETKRKIALAGKGRKHTEEWKKLMSSKMRGRKATPETLKILSLAHKGQMAWNKGKKGLYAGANKGKKFPERSGENHPNWKGGISLAYKVKKVEEQKPRPGNCEICGDMGIICYDHNHKTGQFRGWVCSPCNCIMGFANDNIEKLDKIIEYLKKNATI